MQNVDSNTSSQRSLLYRNYDQDSQSVGRHSKSMDDHSKPESQTLELVDLSLTQRFGYRGLGAEKHLTELGFATPNKPNQVSVSKTGESALRLSNTEFWILNTTSESSELEKKLLNSTTPENCYSLFCQDSHAWLQLSGEPLALAKVMAKLCAVDLRNSEFPLGSIAQTSVARVNAIIVNHKQGSETVFSIFSDSASAAYLWDAIQDAMVEFN